MITAHERYKSAGFACLPTGPDKIPAIPKGSSWKGGWDNSAEYKSSHGIGIICGKASGNLECIDFDNHFGDAKKILTEFAARDGVKEIYEKYGLPIQKTVGGGYHLLYRCDLIEGNQKLASRQNEKSSETLIETRGENGYFCVDPTPGYKILTETFDPPVITSKDRMILLSACRSFNEVVKVPRKAEEETDRPGDIYNKSLESLNDMKRVLRDTGWNELNEGHWRRPGKDKGISATLGIAAPGIFYNFSSSAGSFELNKGYTAFQVVALLKYRGDFKGFAKELHSKQNPKQPTVNTEKKTSSSPDQQEVNEYESLRVDLTSEPLPAPAVLYFKCKDKPVPSFTLQNFSLITGKAKSRKTFLTVLIVASYLGYLNDTIQADSERKGVVLIIDTEQSPYHLHKMMKRICKLIGEENPERLLAYGLKTLTPEEKKNFIDYKIKTTPGLMLVVIDGIRDLIYDINSPEEATKTSVLLMKWCALNNIHILNVLHQNKGDANARGHLGAELTNKAETVLSVNKDGVISTVESEYSRELDFDSFSFIINEDSIPEICNTPEEDKPIKRTEPHFVYEEVHYKVLDQVFKDHKEKKYKDAWTNIKLVFTEEGISFGINKAKEYLAYYIKEGWVSYDESNKCYKYERASF